MHNIATLLSIRRQMHKLERQRTAAVASVVHSFIWKDSYFISSTTMRDSIVHILHIFMLQEYRWVLFNVYFSVQDFDKF